MRKRVIRGKKVQRERGREGLKWELAEGKREEEERGKRKHSLLTLSGNETSQKADRMTNRQWERERAKEDSGWERNKDDKG